MPIRRRPAFAWVASAALATATLTGCTRLDVTSEPAGGRVLWSHNGMEPFRSWPPNGAEVSSKSGTDPQGVVTPLATRGSYSDVIFVTVEKDGYLRPLPQPVQLYAWRHEKVHFLLTETPEAFSARMKAEGKLFYQGAWVDPKVAGVVEYQGRVLPEKEAFRLQQEAAGLVEFEGQWYSAEEAARREAEVRSAAGYVRFKERWLKPEEAAAEKTVDAEMIAVKDSKVYADLPAPRLLGAARDTKDVQLQLYNSTGQTVRFLISGPRSLSIAVPPYRSYGVRTEDRLLVPAGRYDFAVLPLGLDAAGKDLGTVLGESNTPEGLRLTARPAWASWPVAGGQQYSINFTGSGGELQEVLKNLDVPDPVINIQAPTITIPDLPPDPQAREGGPGAPGSGGPRGGGGGGGGGRR